MNATEKLRNAIAQTVEGFSPAQWALGASATWDGHMAPTEHNARSQHVAIQVLVDLQAED